MQKIYYGGDIITMCETGGSETMMENAPEAVLVSDGRIAYVGSFQEAKKRGFSAILGLEGEKSLTTAGSLETAGSLGTGSSLEPELINLQGKTLMPSFIDPHGHISLAAQYTAFCDLSECTGFDEIVQCLKKYQEEHQIQEDGVIMGQGYDHNFLKEQEHPSKYVLDQVSESIPVCILHTSGHMCVVNSALLKQVGIGLETKDPEGGRYGRDEDGSPNGYLEEVPAMQPVLMWAFSRIKMDFAKQMRDAQQIYLKYGITTAQDGATGYQALRGLAALAKQQIYEIDVVSYVMAQEFEQAVKDYSSYNRKYQNHFKIAGGKLVLDGSPQGKSAWLSEPYEGESTYCGYPAYQTEEVEKVLTNAVAGSCQILAHCNGDDASEQFLTCYENALEHCGYHSSEEKKKAGEALRPVMIHCQTVRNDQLDKMAELSMIPSIFAAHTWYWGDVHLKNLGTVRGNHISPAKSALEKGLIYNFHQDTPVIAPDMMKTVWCAVNRQTRSGQSIGPDERISVYDALKGITIHAAYAYHEEDKKGSIEKGKLADLVILDANPLKVKPLELKNIRVLQTIKEGKILYRYQQNVDCSRCADGSSDKNKL
ncbi:MAG: amidohydrolase [Lachnospiraceae bacterium]|nr:amidohydrolase [Lachnospiraceae bacterium]